MSQFLLFHRDHNMESWITTYTYRMRMPRHNMFSLVRPAYSGGWCAVDMYSCRTHKTYSYVFMISVPLFNRRTLFMICKVYFAVATGAAWARGHCPSTIH